MLEVTSDLPSGAKATAQTPDWCSWMCGISLPVATSHRRMRFSAPAEATVLPSGEGQAPRPVLPLLRPENLFAGGHVPPVHHPIQSGGDQGPAVGRERDRLDLLVLHPGQLQ